MEKERLTYLHLKPKLHCIIYSPSKFGDLELSPMCISLAHSVLRDPSVHLSHLDCLHLARCWRDSDPNLSDNEPDGVQDICELPPNNDIDLPIALPGHDEDETPEDDEIVWQNVKGALNEFIFSPSEPPGVTKAASDKISTNKPFEFYSLFVDDEGKEGH
ncbi:hypothetical protein J6590_100896 [Homalodisca vitripennis]|nr:hypothetical protein J6590_100896 [Homalodisca vitripennis]